jgi:hypothetical protein
VNAIKAKRSQNLENFKVVSGEDITKYYLHSNYDKRANESTGLGISCMRYDKCQPYMDFYVKNNVEMVVLMSDDPNQKEKIMGRAILWTIKNIDGQSVDRKFMDRVYTITDYDVQSFKDYAIKNGWLYKNSQNRHPSELICDPKDSSIKRVTMMTDKNYKKTKFFPYLDTLCFFYWEDGYLSNSQSMDGDSTDQPYYLQSANGAYSVNGMRFVPYYNDLISEDDLVWCHYGNDWRYRDDAVEFNGDYATTQYIEENHLKHSNLMDQWIDERESIFIRHYNDYVTRDYADHEMTYSDYDDEYYFTDETVWSEYNNSHLLREKSVLVIMDSRGTMDWRSKNEQDSYIEYREDGRYSNPKYYDKPNFEDDFVLCIVSNGFTSQKVWKHLEWDKNKITDYKGRYFYNTNEEQIKNYIKRYGEN